MVRHKLVLSNGVTVYVKPTDFKADQIMMKGVSLGGTSVFPNDEIINISQLNGVALVGGIGNFSKVDLGKALCRQTCKRRCGYRQHYGNDFR